MKSKERRRQNREHDRHRGSARARGYTHLWDRATRIYKNHNPLCAMCYAKGRVAAATVVDHKVPHKGDPVLFWDVQNWQALCKTCHDQHKQAQERRGYSNEVAVDGWPTDQHHPSNKIKKYSTGGVSESY